MFIICISTIYILYIYTIYTISSIYTISTIYTIYIYTIYTISIRVDIFRYVWRTAPKVAVSRFALAGTPGISGK